jgi:hypothetical protein
MYISFLIYIIYDTGILFRQICLRITTIQTNIRQSANTLSGEYGDFKCPILIF